MSFYRDWNIRSYRTRTTNHFVLFDRHFSQYLNSIYVRCVDLNEITWC